MNGTFHPSADWVYDRVRKEIPNISMGTVYRNLKSLAKSGEIKELDIPGSLSRFDGNNTNHYHCRCEKCGQIFDLDEPVDYGTETRIAEKTGFKVKRHYLEFIRLFWDCLKQEE
jgi:Fe2+ or Zn2+ uptake regulation protein